MPSPEVAQRLFGGVYDVKRVSPGQVLISDPGNWYFTHDATTLGGSSGSAVLGLSTGAVAGVHFRGLLEKMRIAVQRDVCNGPYAKNRLGVLAGANDVEVMLDHALAQMRLRTT